MRFGLPSQDVNITESQWYVRDLKGKSEKHLRAYASIFVQHLCDPGDPTSKTFDDGVPKEGLNVNQVLARIGIVSLIRKKVHEYEDKHGLKSIIVEKKPEVKAVEEKKVIDMAKVTSKQFEMFEDNEPNTQTTAQKAENMETNNETAENKENGETPQKEALESQNIENEEKTSEENNIEDNKNEKKDDTIDEKMDVDKNDEVPASTVDEQNATKNAEDLEKSSEEKSEQNGNKTDTSLEDKKEAESDEKTSQVNDNNAEVKENGQQNNEDHTKDEQQSSEPQKFDKKFDFNIKDGGLTELHTLWYFEEMELKPGKELEVWHRRHDYWMLAAIVKHGYERWKEIHEDDDFRILNEPFKNSIHIKNKFMERRLRLLEQALVLEEQFRRTAHLNKILDETKVETKEDSESQKEEQTNDENKPMNPSIQKSINYFEDLLSDMKSDCGRIPQTVQRIPPIAQRLQLSQKGFNTMQSQKRQISL